MAFEPLETDERVEGVAKAKAPDMDSEMLFGCSGFLLASVGGYALSVWPFFAFQETNLLVVLAQSLAIGLVPTLVLAAVLTRRFGLAGACGAVGGAMASAMFLYLRIQQAFMAYLARHAPEPQYPSSFTYIVPAGYLLAVLLVSVLLLPKENGDGGV